VHQSCDYATLIATRSRSQPIPTPTQKPAAAETLSFEGALKELETIVARLEQGDVDLEDSIALYERGQVLKSLCEQKLKAAESRLEKIVMGADGQPRPEPMETA
jgi:exodeoxyribonuclease VII small subunit